MNVNLDDLSNDEIRVKLLEYGFANLPVTQTTRKILVKKLKIAIDTQKTKNRRDTIAVIRSSDDEDISDGAKNKRERTPNRRATLAVTEKTRKVPASSSSSSEINSRPETPKKSSSRRSSRATPAKDQKSAVSSTANILPIQQEDSDSDVVEIPIITRRSKSKTPIMMKSETVRTSYKNVAAEETIVDSEDYEPEQIVQKPVNRRKTFIEPMRTITPTKFGKTTTLTTSFNPSGNYNFKDHQDEEDEPLNITEKDAPYLSNFAKRLSTLKAEPLDIGLNKYKSLKADNEPDHHHDNYDKYEKPASYNNYRYSQYTTSAIQPTTSKSSSNNNRNVVNLMARDFDKLDRTYSVRKYVYIALLLMIIIAIYVILFL